ncbi:hypothetical protein C900_03005 [Fulvivirga imtechensis AK7]|uniref:Uncharacterized protein n=1 Tax=Fulvivirga imtechensis AK7 TaxID=1237149 RepID=L8JQH1_9BACT|nr:hypothetical protein [Fulvivirga imtechensis]ELR71201.1 hypothetical protein C900_03005 [Fulvivirga imtechensis AK7]
MAEPKSIARDPNLPKSMDYQALRKEGIAYLQQLSGKIWTDYNEHDPGVTILEQICFALTDVAYRTNISIEKLLFYDDDYKTVSDSNALFGPNEILPCGPLTLTDYRILVIDKIREVNNAWLEPVEENKLGISGLYNVVVQISNEVPEDDYQHVKDKVRRLFAASRNLCEDINEVTILVPMPVSINANIDISSDAVGEEVLSELFYHIDQYFNPAVQFHTFEELTEKGMPIEKIFETPSFDHGFIVPGELYLKNDEFYVTKIAEIISSIPGIRNVQDLAIKKNGIKVYGNSINIEPGYFAHLDVSYMESIEITKGGISYEYDRSIARHLYEVKLDKHKSANEARFKWQFDKTVKPFSFSQISDFTSIQNTLPGIYGVGRYGLPDDANEERKAKARQLKGYLLMFDQILANHLVQLEKVKNLFSIDDHHPHTYYAQLPADFPDLGELLKDPAPEAVLRVMSGFDEYLDRKNRILDHLLARFGERFSADVSGKVKNLFGEMSKDEVEQEIIRLKSEFLRNYVRMSRDRAQAFNYLENSIDQANVPTFRRRISFLLNIKDHRQRSLINHHSQIKVDIHEPGSRGISSARADMGQGQEIHYRQAEETQGKATFLVKDRKTLEYLLLRGGSKSNYHIVSASDSKYLVLFYTQKKEFPVKVAEADSAEKAQKLIRKLVAWFNEVSSKSEGFHVVEHILLRPYGIDEFHFQILDRDDAILFDSIESHTYEEQKLRAEDALVAGCDKANYKRVQVRSGKHVIILRDRHNRELARLKGELPSEEGAARKVDDLVKYFKELEKDNTVNQKKLVFTAVKVEQRKVSKDFYNAKMSIILPAWIARFQNEEFRLLLRNSLRQSIPAHISTSFIWLDIEGMKNFESVQKQWLELRQHLNYDWKKLNSLSAKLINILTASEYGRA